MYFTFRERRKCLTCTMESTWFKAKICLVFCIETKVSSEILDIWGIWKNSFRTTRKIPQNMTCQEKRERFQANMSCTYSYRFSVHSSDSALTEEFFLLRQCLIYHEQGFNRGVTWGLVFLDFRIFENWSFWTIEISEKSIEICTFIAFLRYNFAKFP